MSPDILDEAGERAATRVRAFAGFFKNYMGVSSLVVAALPIPIGELGLIPIRESDKHFYSLYTSLFCFLTFAYVFYCRHAIGRILFSKRRHFNVVTAYGRILMAILPAALISSSALFVLQYHLALEGSIGNPAINPTFTNPTSATATSGDAPRAFALLHYLGIFVTAEAAFVLMATKEYLLDVMKLTDRELIDAEPFYARSAPPNFIEEESKVSSSDRQG